MLRNIEDISEKRNLKWCILLQGHVVPPTFFFFFFSSLVFHLVSTLAIAFQFVSEQHVRNTCVVMNARSVAFPSMKNECRIT